LTMDTKRLLRFFGHGIAIAWAGFWLAAGARAGLLEAKSIGEAIGYTLMPGGLCLALVLATWRWERVGAWAVLACGLALVGYSSVQPDVTGPMLLLAGPPLLGGLLLLIHGRMGGAEAGVRTPG
jgi:hypothetical protein